MPVAYMKYVNHPCTMLSPEIRCEVKHNDFNENNGVNDNAEHRAT